jgi:hypothetical protein
MLGTPEIFQQFGCCRTLRHAVQFSAQKVRVARFRVLYQICSACHRGITESQILSISARGAGSIDVIRDCRGMVIDLLGADIPNAKILLPNAFFVHDRELAAICRPRAEIAGIGRPYSTERQCPQLRPPPDVASEPRRARPDPRLKAKDEVGGRFGTVNARLHHPHCPPRGAALRGASPRAQGKPCA